MEQAREVPTPSVAADNAMVAALNKSEIDQQITTAKQYPRGIRQFLDEAKALVTLNEQVAQECIYALPRKERDQATGKTITKNIEGPSARFAEIIAHSWGNARAGARTVDETGDFVTAQGVFHDLEKNVAITYEVKRRITDKHGRRYNADMIGVTANAACSIALRNAVLKGIPKAFWQPLYESARQVVMGDAKTLANRRSDALAFLQKLGATQEMVLELLEVKGIEDITLDHLVTLRGLATAIKDGDTTVEQAFAKGSAAAPGDGTASAADITGKLKGGNGAKKPAASKQEEKPEATPPAGAAAGATQPDPWLDAADKKQAELDAEQEAGLRQAEGGEQ